jgi:flagellar motor switch protein FliG
VSTSLNLTRPQKAAAILVAMGKQSAGRLLKFFKQEELKALIEAARTLKTIPQSELERIVAEFESEFAEGAGLLDSSDTMSSIINETLSPDEIKAIMEGKQPEAEPETQPPIWPELEKLPSDRLAGLLGSEHPQTIAMILANLGSSASAGAVVHLPKDVRGEVIKRMISLGAVPERARSLVENQLRSRLDEQASVKDISAGQIRVANMLNELDKEVLDQVMEDVEAAGAPDIETLRAKLFSFEDVVLLSQKSRVALFDSLPTEQVTAALRGASPDITEAILSAIGARSRRMIEAELKDGAATPPADEIARARKAISSTAIRLSAEGVVELPSMQQAAA